jgi:hypothetical protein
MSAYDLDIRHLVVREHVERLKRDAERPPPRRRRRQLRQKLLLRELPLLSAARRRAASLRPSG